MIEYDTRVEMIWHKNLSWEVPEEWEDIIEVHYTRVWK